MPGDLICPHPGTTPALMVARPRGGAHRTFRQARDCRSSSPRGLPRLQKRTSIIKQAIAPKTEWHIAPADSKADGEPTTGHQGPRDNRHYAVRQISTAGRGKEF